MRHNPLILEQTPIIVFLFGMLFMTSCVPFGHLTRISPEGHEGPQVSQCGTCHVEQYQEWQGSAHAGAFTSKTFQEAAGSPAGEECLQCHTPLGIQEKKTEARSFHQEEGVTCVSCHLSRGKMVGPHATSALFAPHPVQVDSQLYRSPDLCATCHEETQAQWQKATAGQQSKNCQECHMPAVQRRATEGTNPFSNILVSFEDKIQTRSHSTTLENMANSPDAVTITTMAQSHGQDAPALTITIHNNLPHNLPTGTFGAKDIQLALVFLQKGVQIAEKRVVVSDEKQPLAPGDSKRLILPLSSAAAHADTLRLNLERHSDSHTGRPPIILSSKIIDSVSESFH